MKEDETIDTFTTKLTTLINKAASLGNTMEDETLVRKLLNVVPDRYLQIVASIEQYSDLDEMTLEEAIGRLKTYEERIKYKKGKQVDNQEKLMFTRHENKGKYFRGHGRGGINSHKEEIMRTLRKRGKMEKPLIGFELDVKNAFLHGHLKETVYMHQPPGFTDSAPSNYVCLLQKLLYGLKQPPKLGFNDFLAMLFEPTKYATEILEQAQMLNCNPCRTPIDTEKKLGPEGSPVTDPTLYRSLAGSLQYLTFTRPDLSYAVQQLCLYMHDHREPHLNAMKCVFLGDNLLTWSSKRQDTLSRSSAEAEYRRVANAVAEKSWIRNILRELHTPLFTATLVYCDNVSAVYMSANPVQHQHTKHIEIDIYFVRDKVTACHVRVLHVPSRFQYADIFTKRLPYPLFADFRSSLSIRKSPALTAGAC
ncbi:ribonuclease H-like domain-containing protein [Tanacetum coccineum]